jgi:hypothetical protein
MSPNDMNAIYVSKHFKFFDQIVIRKRLEIINIIDLYFKNENLFDVLDIGSTADELHVSSNFIIKNIMKFKCYKSISDQKIKDGFFDKSLQKSITDIFSQDELNEYSSDLVLSNATIEHVGSYNNQIKMVENIIKLSKKFFIIATPNRYHPIEFHSKLPFLHWFPKKIHRFILSIIGEKILSDEKNLNLLSEKEILSIMNQFSNIEYQIKDIKLLFFKSNFIIIGKKLQ